MHRTIIFHSKASSLNLKIFVKIYAVKRRKQQLGNLTNRYPNQGFEVFFVEPSLNEVFHSSEPLQAKNLNNREKNYSGACTPIA